MMRWLVSGACRNVGKTRLAKRLCNALPKAFRVKIGHHPPKEGGDDNYFTNVEDFLTFMNTMSDHSHCLVESNRLIHQGSGDIRIYIDAPPGARDVRPDAAGLRDKADVTISAESHPEQWRRAVASRIDDGALVGTICELFREQRDFLFRREGEGSRES